ncbi:S10 family serine carboxypeptidase-like protein [Phyllobacterium calauticae]|jgi:carboxypeptidase C (cathepsin A)|uniref:S10 family serine carboxypeptidase-like protein n=1 Tax=Phyllobacterium calauticae TaxID=2817027 RepID=UPI001CBAAFCE|nr:hypothetical protein [Phyllobacterium calauticae]MBZ3692092.1 hypothetical protein [Phyllobacterium calauticae]
MIVRILLLVALLGLTACNKENTETEVSQGTFDVPSASTAALPIEEAGTKEPDKVKPEAKPSEIVIVAPGTSPDKPETRVSQNTSDHSTTPVTPPIAPPSIEETARKKAGDFKAAGKLQEAAIALRSAGLDKDAFELFAPEDYAFNVNDHPAKPSSPEVSETPSVKRHSMTLNGKTVWYTAKAGHIIAYGQKDPKTGGKDAKAAIFYMSYTRDDLPHESRPVTFLFNGGPGYASVFLHMAAFGPKRIKIDAPFMPMKKSDLKFPVVDNEETLLDHTDLVFVDPVGTGFSKAIAPHADKEFYAVNADAEVARDFITSYTNRNHRQSSPKYLLGESWGSARVSLTAALLEDAGTSNLDPDPSGKPPVVLSGVVLSSPYLSGEACKFFGMNSCNTEMPTNAITAEYFQKPGASWRGNRTIDQYADYIRQFAVSSYIAVIKEFPTSTSRTDIALTKHGPVLQEFRNIGGNQALTWGDFFKGNILTNRPAAKYHGSYDARMIADDYDPDFFDDDVLGNGVKTHLQTFMNYSANADATDVSGGVKEVNSTYAINCGCRSSFNEKPRIGGVADLTQALTADPHLTVMALHGYYDQVTPFFETETQLKQAGLDKLIPMHLFEGGHMFYYSEAARKPMKKVLDEFYTRAPVIVATN